MNHTYSKLEEWRMASQELAFYKEQEMALRKQVLNLFFPIQEEGSNNVELSQGWSLKATVPYTRSLDQKKMVEVLKDLKKHKAPAALIKTTYTLSVAEYRELDAGIKSIIDTVLTTKPGTPSMELIAPKSA